MSTFPNGETEQCSRVFSGSSGPPDKKTLSKWFGYRDARYAQNALRAFTATFLDALDKEQLVERSACPGDLSGEGAGLIKETS